MTDETSGIKLKRPAVLVVEDESIVAEDLKVHLHDMGYHVPAMEFEGERAVKAALEHNPDVILMDIRLGGRIDGIEAAHRIRKQSRIPVIFLTSYPDRDIVRRASFAGPAGYLLKPVNYEGLDAAIQLALSTRRIPLPDVAETGEQQHNPLPVGEHVIVISADYRLEMLNRRALGHTGGRSRGDTPPFCYRKLHGLNEPCHEHGIICPIRELTKSGRPLTIVHEHLTRGGVRSLIEITAAPMWAPDGTIRGGTFVSRKLPIRDRYGRGKRSSRDYHGADSCTGPTEASISLCSSCSSVLGRKGNWLRMEEYLSEHSGTHCTPRLCPTCSSRFRPGQRIPALSDREKEVLSWIRQGKSTWDISQIIGIKESTVKFHVGRAMQKLGAVTRTQAVVLAIDLGILDKRVPPKSR